MAATLCKFPTLQDRFHIHNLIQTYALGKISRNNLMHWIANIVKKYDLERIPVFNYSVRILDYFNDLPIISIEGAEISDSCPVCRAGQDHARYLRTEAEYFDREYDEASHACIECGCVFVSKVPNGRKVNRNGRVIQ